LDSKLEDKDKEIAGLGIERLPEPAPIDPSEQTKAQ
jgi:hypothetical protein